MNARSVGRDAARTLSATAVYLVALQVVGILVVQVLGVGGRGEVAAAVLVPTIIAIVGTLGVPVATGYLVNARSESRATVIATARTVGLLLAIIMGVASGLLCWFFPVHDGVRFAASLFSLYVPLTVLASVHQSVLQADMRLGALNASRLIGVVVYLGLVVGLAVLDVASVTAVVLSQLAGIAVWTALSVILVSDRPWLAFDRPVARSLVAYGVRGHLGAMGTVDNLRVDQLALALFLSTYDLGLYVVAMTFFLANRMVGTSIGTVAFPVAARSTNQIQRRRLLTGLVGLTLGLTLVAVLVETLYGRALLRIFFDVDDPTAYEVLVLAAVASLFVNLRQVTNDILRGRGKPGIPTIGEVVGLVSLVALAILLWNRGVVGVAWAVLVAYGLSLASVLTVALVGSREWQRATPSARRLRIGLPTACVVSSCGVAALTGFVMSEMTTANAVAMLVAFVGSLILLLVMIRSGVSGIATLMMIGVFSTLAWNNVRLTTFMALSDAFLLVAAAFILPRALVSTTPETLRPSFPVLSGVGLILLGGTVGSVLSGSLATGLGPMLRFAIAALLTPVIVALWRPGRRLIGVILSVWIASVVVSGAMGLLGDRDIHGRIQGLSAHPNHLAITCVLAIGPTIVFALSSSKAARVLSYGAIGIILAAAVASGSRSGLLGLAVAIPLTLVLVGRWRLTLVTLAGTLTIFALATQQIVPIPENSGLDRLVNSRDASVMSSNEDRSDRLIETFSLIREQPLVGHGFADALSAHNVYLQLWVSGGIVAVVGLLLVMKWTIVEPAMGILRGSATGDPRLVRYLAGLLGSFSGFMAAEFFQNALWERFFWIMPSLVVVVSAMLVLPKKAVMPASQAPSTSGAKRRRRQEGGVVTVDQWA